ncbi:MAG TPA: hypothetical protein VEC14_14160 [Reyranellaceae bacterium]|nr:hypothetical protein [Reyranellaceae bacterium]
MLATLIATGIVAGGFLAAEALLGFEVAVLLFGLLLVSGMPKASYTLGAHTNVANLWTPAIWVQGMAERVTTRPSLINSGIMARDRIIQEAAEGPGTKIEIPFIKEPNISDGIQVENNDVTIDNLTSGKQTAAILNRRWGIGNTALSKAVSGADPLRAALDFMSDIRLRQRQVTLLNILRGVFGFAAAPGAGAAAFKPMRRDIFSETGAAPTAEKLFSSDEFVKTLGLFGEVKDNLDSCAIVCHSAIEQAMLLQDDITFIRDSEGNKRIKTYKGAPVFVSDLLSRAGTVSGTVYDIYIFLPGAIAYGEKPQTSEVGEVAALLKVEDAKQNNVGYADYTRFIMHPQGAAWTGNPAGQSATNAELATEGNWSLAYGDAKNVRVACLRTNG